MVTWQCVFGERRRRKVKEAGLKGISRMVKYQLAVLAVVRTVGDEAGKYKELKGASNNILLIVDRLKQGIAKRHHLRLVDGVLELNEKDNRAWQRNVLQLVEAVRARYPGETLDAKRWTNAALLMAEDQANSMPREPVERKQNWLDLVRALNELYELMDPSLDDQQAMDLGQADGESLQAAIEA